VSTETSAAERRDALVERLFAATINSFELSCVYIGHRLGLYRALADGGLTSAELAERAGIHERYAREWLEQQAASGVLDVERVDADAGDRRYTLPPGHDEALLDEDSLAFAAPFALFHIGVVTPLDQLLEAFKTGAGVPYAEFGEDLHVGQGSFTRPIYRQLLGKEWLASVPEIHERLSAHPPARVADIACGHGHSSIAIAAAYPNARVDGLDLDEASIEWARSHLEGSGVEDRVTFQHRDAAHPALEGRYDLVTILESLHDMSYPVEVLRAARGLLADGGSVFVGDERTEERFAAPAGDLERFYYGVSVLHCLPVGMVGENSAGTGTVMRPDTVRRYATEAGFGEVQVLPIENDFYRFYRLVPKASRG
jgi:2-polyprenyl-3-methyl-5-hydroxy-6-metoxy-1,4-benzoquinol methylase